jgi:hypothetical protein
MNRLWFMVASIAVLGLVVFAGQARATDYWIATHPGEVDGAGTDPTSISS